VDYSISGTIRIGSAVRVVHAADLRLGFPMSDILIRPGGKLVMTADDGKR